MASLMDSGSSSGSDPEHSSFGSMESGSSSGSDSDHSGPSSGSDSKHSGPSSGSDSDHSGPSSGSDSEHSGPSSGSDSEHPGPSSSLIDNRPQKRPRISSGIDRLSDLPDPSGIDRLSDLPDSMIFHILSFLPTKKVVATSILSTRWKSLWTKVTSFDVSFDDAEARGISSRKFAQIVNKVLLFRNSECLHKFNLDWRIIYEEEADYVNMWVSYAVARNLRSCYLNLGAQMDEVNLPSTIFTCKTLECLQLKGCFTFRVPSLVCLPKLEALSLRFLSYESNESIHKLVSGCPVLRYLTITRTDTMDMDHKISSLSLKHLVVHYMHVEPDEVPVYDKKLEIDAPNLEFLNLGVLTSDCSIKGPSALLNQAILELGKNGIAVSDAVSVSSDRCNSTVKLIETLNRVKYLNILGDTMMAISRATTLLSTRFERLIRLDIDVPCCEWSSLSVMLGCCNRLKYLKIRVCRSCADTHKQCWKDPEQVPECLLSSLLVVTFQPFKGLKDEMSLVKYFLKHSSVLVLFDICASSSTSVQKLQMLQEISMFTRLSTPCSVQFA